MVGILVDSGRGVENQPHLPYREGLQRYWMKDKVNEGRYRILERKWCYSNLEENQLEQKFSVTTIWYFVPSHTAFDLCSHLRFSMICSPFSRSIAYCSLLLLAFQSCCLCFTSISKGNYWTFIWYSRVNYILLALRFFFCY